MPGLGRHGTRAHDSQTQATDARALADDRSWQSRHDRLRSPHSRVGRGPSVPETANVAPPLRLRAGALPASPVGPAPEFALATAARLEGFPRTQGTSTGTARAAPQGSLELAFPQGMEPPGSRSDSSGDVEMAAEAKCLSPGAGGHPGAASVSIGSRVWASMAQTSRTTLRAKIADSRQKAAGATGLEPATSGVTGRHSNQLSYAPQSVRASIGPGRRRPVVWRM